MSDKIRVSKVEILSTEGDMKTPRTFQEWRDVDAAMFYMAARRPSLRGGYYKTWFRITFADGDTYEGRLDVERGETSIRAHVTRYARFHSGRACPYYTSEAEWRAYLQRSVSPERQATFARLLDEYDLEGEMVNVAGLAARIPASSDVVVRERVITMAVGDSTDSIATFTFRSPAPCPDPKERCYDFAVRLAAAIAEGAADPFARARALRGQVREVD